MDVAALLLPADLPRARVAIGIGHTVHPIAGLAGLELVLRTRSIDVVLIDPVACSAESCTALAACLRRYVHVPFIAYVSVSPIGMRHLMAMAALGVRRVLLRGYDDTPAALRATLNVAHADTLSGHVLRGLCTPLETLPPELSAAIAAAFRAPQTIRTAGDLARSARLPLRTCSRLLTQAGLATPRSFLGAARVINAYHALRAGKVRVADVAADLGYGSAEALVRDTRHLTGLRPRALARATAPEALAAHLVRRLGIRTSAPRRLTLVPSRATVPDDRARAIGAGPLSGERPTPSRQWPMRTQGSRR